MSGSRQNEPKEAPNQQNDLFKPTEIVQATPEGTELEKQLRSNPNNKITGRIINGDLTTFQRVRGLNEASLATLFPNKTPEEIAKIFSAAPDADTSATPQKRF